MSESHVNMFGGSPLNRLSWLRPSQSFLNAIIALPNTKWLVFNSGQPLMVGTEGRADKPIPAILSTSDLKPILGEEPYFGQGKVPGELITEKGESEIAPPQHSPTEAARHLNTAVIFLGLHEETSGDSTAALPSSDFKDPEAAIEKLKGTPYFAIDVADSTPEAINNFLKLAQPSREGKTLSWSEPRALMSTLEPFIAAIFASARSMVDWNLRNRYCAGCGSPTYSMWGGWKIACRTLLPWADKRTGKPCPTAKGLHNFTHPRTDAVVIMIAIDETGDKILLGRGRKFPGMFYSALAGFIEPGESFEDAVVREMWEEAGIHVWNIRYHSGQPWPYPANLMVGFYVRADSTKPIRTDLDNELVDARWFTREEVLQVLTHAQGTRMTNADHKKYTEYVEGKSNTEQQNLEPTAQALTPAITKPPTSVIEGDRSKDEPPFRVPPATAIAGVLIRDWAFGTIGIPVSKQTEQVLLLPKGNL